MKQLENLKFCKIKKGTKKPLETDWTNRPYSWTEIQSHISKEINFGVLTGYEDLIIVDSDSSELLEIVNNNLPKTFRVKTGGGGTHDYYFCKDVGRKIILENEKHHGEILSWGCQAIAVGSIHPNGCKYEVIQDMPITKISKEELYFALKDFIKEISNKEEFAVEEIKKYGDNDINSIPITSIINTAGFKRRNNGELIGANVWHGSVGGGNFCINPSKNVGFCFRCGVGVNVAQAIGLNEGLISNCNDRLSRDGFFEVLKIAKSKYGLQQEQGEVKTANIKKEEPLKSIPMGLLLKEKVEKDSYLIENLILENSIITIYGEPASLKSIVANYISCCIATKTKFLGKFKTKKAKVLYLSAENPKNLDLERFKAIFKGMKIIPAKRKKENLLFEYVGRKDIGILNDDSFYTTLNEKISSEGINLLVIDTLSPLIMNLNDNEARAVVEVFHNRLMPLIDKYNIAILLVMHSQKTGKDFLGSVKFKGESDLFFESERKDDGSGVIVLNCMKARRGEFSFEFKVDFINRKGYNPYKIDFTYQNSYYGKQTPHSKGVDFSQIKKAEEIIKQLLLDSELKYSEILSKGTEASISVSSMKRAMNNLYRNHIIKKRMGKNGGYYT